MYIHEYQAKELLKKFDIEIPKGYLVNSKDDLEKAFSKLGCSLAVAKTQVYAGGRGKAGGVKLIKNLEEGLSFFDKFYNKRLVTNQTDEKGEIVNSIYLEEVSDIDRELYFSMTLNRDKKLISIIASNCGGMDIELVAEKTPDKIVKLDIDPLIGITDYMVRDIFFLYNLDKSLYPTLKNFIVSLYKIYVSYDAELIEINPLVVTKSSKLIALDAKMSFDDNALYRQKEILSMKNNDVKTDAELYAEKLGFSYVSLYGSIGCLVNGAGLAMATMDSINFSGHKPANFLDIGGGGNAEQISKALKIIFTSSNVKGVLINVFGGINHCDVIANGVVKAITDIDTTIPVVVRLKGADYEKGVDIIKKSKLNIHIVPTLDSGAELVTKLVNGELL